VPGSLRGDEECTAMAASSARDGDLAFGEADAEWARAAAPAGGVHPRAHCARRRLLSDLYPPLVAPFYAAVGDAGFWLFNVLAVGAALALARAAPTPRRRRSALPTVPLFAFDRPVPYRLAHDRAAAGGAPPRGG
jgi:hypothetical protein